MWTVLAEQPLLIAIMIGIVAAALAYGWLQTGDRRIAFSTLGAACLIPVPFVIAGSIITDRERILETIYSTATAVEQNDHETAVSVIADPDVRQRALAELPNFEFHRIRVRNVMIKMIEGSLPAEAEVDIDASVLASQTRGSLKNVRVVRRIILTFQQQHDGTWMVTDYTHLSLNGQADNFTPKRL